MANTNNTNIFSNAISATSTAMTAAFGLSSAILSAQSSVTPMTKTAAKKTNEFKVIKAEQRQVEIIYNTVLAGVKAGNPGIKDADAEAAAEAMGVQKPLTDDEIIEEIIANDLNNKKAEAKQTVINSTAESMSIISGFAELAANRDVDIVKQLNYAPQPQPVVVPAEPTLPQQVAAPTSYQPSQWDRHCSVTRDIRSERFELEKKFKEGQIGFADYIKLKSALNMEAFSQHCSVTATKHRR